MLYKLVFIFVVLFSLKTFSAEGQTAQNQEDSDSLAKKQLELIIKEIKEESSNKPTKAKS